MRPVKVVCRFDHNVTWPPSPLCVASALIVLALSTLSVVAVVTPGTAAPAWPPPMVTLPPPVAPEASMVAPFRLMVRPPIAIDPPRARFEATFTEPDTFSTPPAPASSTMAPPTRRAELADSEPEMLTMPRTASAAVAALIAIRPPAARTVPEMSIRGWLALPPCVGRAICSRPSPLRSSVACSPEPMAILPAGAEMIPELATLPPSRPTKPPWPVDIVPALLTAAEAPLPEKLRAPLIKSEFEMSKVEPTKPAPTFTAPLAVIAMPLGLMRNTWPLASSWPARVEAAEPLTRFSTAEPLPGCTNVTVPPCPMEKFCQSRTARALVWVMVRLLPELAPIVADPALTTPPFGSTVCAAASVEPASSAAIRAIADAVDFSATAEPLRPRGQGDVGAAVRPEPERAAALRER